MNQSRRGKYVIHDHEKIMSRSDEKICRAIDERQAALILEALSVSVWRSRWSHMTDDEYDQVRLMVDDAMVEMVVPSAACVSPEDEPGCIEYHPSATFIAYTPNDPFQTPDFVPQGWLLPPWYHNPSVPLPGVLPTDAMVNFASIPLFVSLPDIISSGLPNMRIATDGWTGELEIEFVKVLQGGYAFVRRSSTLIGDFIDLAQVGIGDFTNLEVIFDLILEGGLVSTQVHEVQVTSADAFVDVLFLPQVLGDSILGFGGGVRRVSICSESEEREVVVPQFRVEACALQWRPNESHQWVTLSDNICGADGADGAPGADGADGAPGADGADGAPGADGECPSECLPGDVFEGEVLPDDLADCNAAYGIIAGYLNDAKLFFDVAQAYNDNAYGLVNILGATTDGIAVIQRGIENGALSAATPDELATAATLFIEMVGFDLLSSPTEWRQDKLDMFYEFIDDNQAIEVMVERLYCNILQRNGRVTESVILEAANVITQEANSYGLDGNFFSYLILQVLPSNRAKRHAVVESVGVNYNCSPFNCNPDAECFDPLQALNVNYTAQVIRGQTVSRPSGDYIAPDEDGYLEVVFSAILPCTVRIQAYPQDALQDAYTSGVRVSVNGVFVEQTSGEGYIVDILSQPIDLVSILMFKEPGAFGEFKYQRELTIRHMPL